MLRQLVVLAGLIIASPVQASDPKSDEETSLLWKIEHEDLKQPSYLFGTIHLICEEDYFWSAEMGAALASSREVCFEMDLDDPGLISEMALGMIDPSGNTLEDYFSTEDYNKIEQFVRDSLGINLSVLNRMKPAALQALFASRGLSCLTPVSYENNILEAARKLDLQITGLESPSEQIALFDQIPVDSIIREIVNLVENNSNARLEYRRLLDAYQSQNLAALSSILEESGLTHADKEIFLYRRNKKWIDRMVEKMEQQPVFFAVGAGHLWGNEGLIQLLRQEGFKLTPVR